MNGDWRMRRRQRQWPQLPLAIVLLALVAAPDAMEGSRVGKWPAEREEFRGDELNEAPLAEDPWSEKATPGPIVSVVLSGSEADVAELVDGGADLEERGPDEATPLWIAASCNNTAAVRILIDAGADLEARNMHGETPLWAASRYGNTQAVVLLLTSGADIEAADASGSTPLIVASQYGHVDVVRALVYAGAHTEAKLIYSGRTALWVASFTGHLPVVSVLLEYGALVDAMDADGAAPLFVAAQEGHLWVVVQLARYGAVLDQRRSDGATALHAASAFCHKEIVKLLVEQNADTMLLDDGGHTAADVVGSGRCPTLHRQYTIEIFLRPVFNAAREDQANIVLASIDTGAVNVDTTLNSNNMTLLHVASAFGSECVIIVLMSRGADPRAVDIHGSKPADVIGNNKKVNLLQRFKLLRLLHTSEEEESGNMVVYQKNEFTDDLRQCSLQFHSSEGEDSNSTALLDSRGSSVEQAQAHMGSDLVVVLVSVSSTFFVVILFSCGYYLICFCCKKQRKGKDASCQQLACRCLVHSQKSESSDDHHWHDASSKVVTVCSSINPIPCVSNVHHCSRAPSKSDATTEDHKASIFGHKSPTSKNVLLEDALDAN